VIGPQEATRGFTLIEMIVVIVVLGVAALGLMGLFGQAVASIGTNTDAQMAAQAAQQGAEILLGRRRASGIGAVAAGTTACNVVGTNYSWQAVVASYNAGSAGCPNTTPAPACKLVDVYGYNTANCTAAGGFTAAHVQHLVTQCSMNFCT
jgi:prepilin-type N-terminal cleavage/methylation domain-containing protein